MEIVAPRSSPGFAQGEIALGEFYEAIFGHSEFAVYVLRIDEDGACTFDDANEGVARLAGRPPAEIVGRAPAECLPAEIAECLVANLATVLETGTGLTYERTIELPEARLSWKTSLMPVPHQSGRIRHVVGLTRDISREADLLARAKHNASLLQSLGLTLPSAIFLFNLKTRNIHFIGGDVDEYRRQWRKSAEDAGPRAPEKFIHADDLAKAVAHWDDLAALEDGEISTIDYRILSPGGEYRTYLDRETVFRRGDAGEVELVLGVSEDISEQERTQQEVRDLSEKMLTLQVDEQRRIAQEFHDSTGQHLVAASLALGRVQAGVPAMSGADPGHDRLAEAIDDARQSLQHAHRELRVLSYLLHPPEIRNQGLGDAVAHFATGFARRAGLDVEIRVAPAANAIGEEMAVHLFRVCQEAFTNVHRHAAARKVFVALDVDKTHVRLTVTDDGIGFDEPELERLGAPGVGFDGMRERMSRLGGSVKVSGGKGGTTLVAVAPRGVG